MATGSSLTQNYSRSQIGVVKSWIGILVSLKTFHIEGLKHVKDQSPDPYGMWKMESGVCQPKFILVT
ncbi:hypothetical protein TNCV_1109091 [Trichonephila clavipes]|nr:hypothetical protein TNCV_1109091 [Trichonephila clavipes]